MAIMGGSAERPPPGIVERIKGGLLLASLLYTWGTGVLVIPATLVSLLVFRDVKLLVVLAIYYGYRIFHPAKEWSAFNRMYRQGTRYFTRSDTLFDGFKSLEENSGRMVCVHPHGILTIGWAYVSCDPVLLHAKIKWLATESLFQLPFISDFLSWNNFAMATKEYMLARMKKKVNLGLLPGGFEEATMYERGKFRVYIEKRTGFIALALRHGYKLHPAFVFGEEQTYWAFTGLQQARLMLNKYKLPGVVFAGFFGLLPYWDINLVTVVGPAVELPKIDQPTAEDVDKYHKIYKKALVDLFERHKAQYAPPGATLEIY